jgi:hypothetical protein
LQALALGLWSASFLQVSVIPFTLIAILPTNKQLLSPTLDKRSVRAGQLLARWGALHAVRSVLGALALFVFLYLCDLHEARVTGIH